MKRRKPHNRLSGWIYAVAGLFFAVVLMGGVLFVIRIVIFTGG